MSGSLLASASGSGELLADENLTFHCNLKPYFPPSLGIPDAINKLQATIAFMTALIGLPMTSYLLFIIINYKQLHQRSFFICLQILVIEILYYLVIPITILTSGITGYWVFGEAVCNMTAMIHDAFAVFRFSMMFVLTLDRFFYIFWPFFYSKHGGLVVWLLSGFMLILSLGRVIIPLHGILDCFIYIPTFKTCTIYSGCSGSCEFFAATSITFIVLFGVVFPFIMYTLIFIKIKRLSNQSKASNDSEGVTRNVQESSAQFRRNRRILITIFSLLIAIVFGTFPAFSLYIINLFYYNQLAARDIFVTNMLIGRTFFNLIPVFDAIAFSRHEAIKTIIISFFKSLSRKILHYH